MKTKVDANATTVADTRSYDYGHINYCSDCREWKYHHWTLLDNDRLEKRCECGRAVEFTYAAGQWLPLPVYDFFAIFTDSLISRAEKKYREKVRKQADAKALADFDALLEEYDEEIVQRKRRVAFRDWLIGRPKA